MFVQKSFSLAGHLKKHVLTRTGDKLHKCNFCKKTFEYASYLSRHTLTHAGDKPHDTDMYATFSPNDDLYPHININMTHSGDKPCECDICGLGALTYFYDGYAPQRVENQRRERFYCHVMLAVYEDIQGC